MKRHSTDLVSFTFGLIFVLVVGLWGVGRFIDIDWDVPHLGWIAAGGLILLGLLGVVASLRRSPADSDADPALAPVPERDEPA